LLHKRTSKRFWILGQFICFELNFLNRAVLEFSFQSNRSRVIRDQARGGPMGQLPPQSESWTKLFQVNQAFDV